MQYGVVKVNHSVHKCVKIASAISGKTISEILNEALVDWLEKNSIAIEKEVAGQG